MEKNPREMSNAELLVKLEEDGVNAKATWRVRGERVDEKYVSESIVL